MENLKSTLSNAMSSKQSLKTFSEHIFSQLTCCIISRDFTMTVKVNFHSHGSMMLMIHPKARRTQHQLCIRLIVLQDWGKSSRSKTYSFLGSTRYYRLNRCYEAFRKRFTSKPGLTSRYFHYFFFLTKFLILRHTEKFSYHSESYDALFHLRNIPPILPLLL